MWIDGKGSKKISGGDQIGKFESIYPLIEQEVARKYSNLRWPNESKCAVSFAYIGGLPEHVDFAPPLLQQLGFRASFYVDPDVVLEEARLWKNLVGSKHEFGCAPFESQTFDGNLYGWTANALIDELNLAKDFVRDFFEVEPKGLAHRSSKLSVSGVNASMISHNLFRHVITGAEGINGIDSDIKTLVTVPKISYSANWLNDLGLNSRLSWIIIPFRSMFMESTSAILLHRLILESINRKRKDLWIAPVGEVATELTRLRSQFE